MPHPEQTNAPALYGGYPLSLWQYPFAGYMHAVATHPSVLERLDQPTQDAYREVAGAGFTSGKNREDEREPRAQGLALIGVRMFDVLGTQGSRLLDDLKLELGPDNLRVEDLQQLTMRADSLGNFGPKQTSFEEASRAVLSLMKKELILSESVDHTDKWVGQYTAVTANPKIFGSPKEKAVDVVTALNVARRCMDEANA